MFVNNHIKIHAAPLNNVWKKLIANSIALKPSLLFFKTWPGDLESSENKIQNETLTNSNKIFTPLSKNYTKTAFG